MISNDSFLGQLVIFLSFPPSMNSTTTQHPSLPSLFIEHEMWWVKGVNQQRTRQIIMDYLWMTPLVSVALFLLVNGHQLEGRCWKLGLGAWYKSRWVLWLSPDDNEHSPIFTAPTTTINERLWGTTTTIENNLSLGSPNGYNQPLTDRSEHEQMDMRTHPHHWWMAMASQHAQWPWGLISSFDKQPRTHMITIDKWSQVPMATID